MPRALIMGMHANITAPAYAAAALNLAIARYERLASPPRHLQSPLVGDMQATERAAMRALERGDEDRYVALADLWLAETTRLQALAAWRGRSLYAWRELYHRLWMTRQAAVDAGVLSPDSDAYRAIADRIADVRGRMDLAIIREQRGEVALA